MENHFIERHLIRHKKVIQIQISKSCSKRNHCTLMFSYFSPYVFLLYPLNVFSLSRSLSHGLVPKHYLTYTLTLNAHPPKHLYLHSHTSSCSHTHSISLSRKHREVNHYLSYTCTLPQHVIAQTAHAQTYQQTPMIIHPKTHILQNP